ncbi:bifunctional acetate--CoA ligase family protein/GNAT family N-acetyltransferase [Robbsia andropogonis]|uniref:bifunctional acetate--CoA ligase family protein/GNAT family N-acetyltransferase n=1 Tax=Robbsia andropogonis TaxID=28092 RepID=UPI000B2B1BF9|nr:GNAT family N-acetyltransferase [Robbsia andropogonis]
MSIRHLDALFRPRSVVIVAPSAGAGNTPPRGRATSDADAVGQIIAGQPAILSYTASLLETRLVQGGSVADGTQVRRHAFLPGIDSDGMEKARRHAHAKGGMHGDPTDGDAFRDHPGVAHAATLRTTAAHCDLALVCTAPEDWPSVIDALVDAGVRAAVLYGDPHRRLDETTSTDVGGDIASDALMTQVLARARRGMLRVLGPSSSGIVSSRAKLHASTGDTPALEGRVALISQSRSFANAAVSWASARHIGFSKVITSGREADIDSADLLDYLASDGETGAIALSMDFVAPDAMRKFLSAARAASRNKPVLVLRARHERADDALFTAAFRRAGMVRVESIEDLLDAIETLHVGRFAGSDAATILSNGGFTGALAADALHAAGGRLAVMHDPVRDGGKPEAMPASTSETSTPALAREALPWRNGRNPINLGETADPSAYDAAIRALAPQSSTGALFVVHTPSVHAPALPLARTVAAHAARWPRALMTCWLGDFDPAVRTLLHQHKIAVFPTPQRLARAFAAMREYQRNQVLLAETPESIGQLQADAIAAARAGLQQRLASGAPSDMLTHDDAFALLATLLPHAPDLTSRSAEARETGNDERTGPFMALTVKRDLHFGMVLGVTPPGAFPGAPTQQTEWTILPINTVLSGDLVGRLPSAPTHGHASFRAFTRFLARLSDVIVAVPEIAGLSLRAAHRHDDGIVMRDCTLRVTAPDSLARLSTTGASTDTNAPRARYRFTVRPYPAELESTVHWQGQAITVRPIRPQDEHTHRILVESMTDDDLRMRFFGAVNAPEHSQLARMTQIDYDREMAFIATTEIAQADGGAPTSVTLGVVRAVADADNETAEFAVLVRSDRKGLRLGALLMQRIIAYCRARGTRAIVGEVLAENTRMIKLARTLGFVVERSDEPDIRVLRLVLQPIDATIL